MTHVAWVIDRRHHPLMYIRAERQLNISEKPRKIHLVAHVDGRRVAMGFRPSP